MKKTCETYQKAAMRTSPEGHDRVLNGCLGLIGESGEVADVVKKWLFQSGENAELPAGKMAEELGDVLWYCAELCTGLDISLGDVWSEAAHLSWGRITLKDMPRQAARLAADCVRVYDMALYAAETPETIILQLAFVLRRADTILRDICHSSLTACMDGNIAKLMARYPDGFDPERSLHRGESSNG